MDGYFMDGPLVLAMFVRSIQRANPVKASW